jgi:glycosyltransferase involved in cell wall biosynthesis
VVFPGRIPYQEAPRYLALGDVAVAPKMSVTEGAGKIPSYMAMELPTITFDSPVSREFLGDLGIYAELGNVQSLADKILLALSPQVQHSGLGHDLRLRVLERFSLEQARQQIETVYQTSIARLKKPRATQLVATPTEADYSIKK